MQVYLDILSFLEYTASQGYIAIDFYDGSIMYDFTRHKTVICDIDFFRKSPVSMTWDGCGAAPFFSLRKNTGLAL